MANKGFARKDRVNEQIRRELAEFIRTEIKDPRIGMISLTAVEITPDYAHAKVFYTTLADAETRPVIEAGLKRSAGFMRRAIGRLVRIHTTPELHFVYDGSLERGSSLSKLIDEAVSTHAADSDDSPEQPE